MQQLSDALGGIGLTQELCDNPDCQKASPMMWPGLHGKRYCSNKCLKAVEENNMTDETNTAMEDAPVAKTKKKAGKAKAKGKAKKAAPKKGGASKKYTGDETITILKKMEGRGEVANRLALLKNGMKVKKFQEVMAAAKQDGPTGFLRYLSKMGVVKVA